MELGAANPFEIWHRRLVLFSVTTTLALGVEVGYTQLVPKLPHLYAILLRAALWDCILVGVLFAQLIDLSSWTDLVGTEVGHFLPVAVLAYHTMNISVCVLYEVCTKGLVARGQIVHPSFVSRRVLLELGGGASGSKLLLGRVCFLVSCGAMWFALHVLMWIDDGRSVLTAFIVIVHGSYCAAGFAAVDPKRAGHGRLVQWLCTGWSSREAFLQGPLKISSAVIAMPFAISVIAAQIWLRIVAMLVWLTVAWPCCRLRQDQNVFDAFEREMVVPLLQCAYLAFACTLPALVTSFDEWTWQQRVIVCTSAAYYTLAMFLWTTPVALQSKIAAEESFEAVVAMAEEGHAELLRGERDSTECDVELEDMRSTCAELRALLYRERHDHIVEIAHIESKVRDQEFRTRAAEQVSQDLAVDKAQWKRVAAELDTKQKALEEQISPSLPKAPEMPPQTAEQTVVRVTSAPLVAPRVRPELPRLQLPERAQTPPLNKDIADGESSSLEESCDSSTPSSSCTILPEEQMPTLDAR